jgi:hypothetical protein
MFVDFDGTIALEDTTDVPRGGMPTPAPPSGKRYATRRP